MQIKSEERGAHFSSVLDNFLRLPNGHLLSGCVHNIWRVAKYVCVMLKSTFLHLSQMASYIKINDMYN